MTELRVADLRYVLFPSGEPRSEWAGAYNEAFRLWKAVWSETLKALDGSERIFSDDFTRQSLVGGLFHHEKCLSLGLFHSVDFRNLPASEDSYFKVWSKEALELLTKEGSRICVGSNITVDPAYRGDLGNGVQLKNVLIGLMVKTFLQTGDNAMTGTMRCDRNMHSAAHRYGAHPLVSGVQHHGVEVELVAFYRNDLLQKKFSLDLATEGLWRNRTDFTQLQTGLLGPQMQKGNVK